MVVTLRVYCLMCFKHCGLLYLVVLDFFWECLHQLSRQRRERNQLIFTVSRILTLGMRPTERVILQNTIRDWAPALPLRQKNILKISKLWCIKETMTKHGWRLTSLLVRRKIALTTGKIGWRDMMLTQLWITTRNRLVFTTLFIVIWFTSQTLIIFAQLRVELMVLNRHRGKCCLVVSSVNWPVKFVWHSWRDTLVSIVPTIMVRQVSRKQLLKWHRTLLVLIILNFWNLLGSLGVAFLVEKIVRNLGIFILISRVMWKSYLIL